MKTLTTLLATVALASPALADNTLPEPVARMECLVGTWKGTGTITLGTETTKITGTWKCTHTSGKHAVLCTAKITGIPGLPVFEETDLFGFEPNTQTYHWASVTNVGETHDHVAKLEDSSKVQFVYTGTHDAKPLKETLVLEFLGPKKKADTITLRGETVVGGATMSVIALKLRK